MATTALIGLFAAAAAKSSTEKDQPKPAECAKPIVILNPIPSYTSSYAPHPAYHYERPQTRANTSADREYADMWQAQRQSQPVSAPSAQASVSPTRHETAPTRYYTYAECAAQPAQAKQTQQKHSQTAPAQPQQRQAAPPTAKQQAQHAQYSAKQVVRASASSSSAATTSSQSSAALCSFPGLFTELPVSDGMFSFVESDTLEFKAGGGEFSVSAIRNTACKYICAFLNSSGGALVFGVEDSREVLGVSWSEKMIDQLKCSLDQALKNDFNPPIDPVRIRITNHPLASKKLVVVIHVATPIAGDRNVYRYCDAAWVRGLASVNQMSPSVEADRVRNGRPVPAFSAETYFTPAPKSKPSQRQKAVHKVSAAPSPPKAKNAPSPSKGTSKSKQAPPAAKTAKKAPVQAQQSKSSAQGTYVAKKTPARSS